MIGETLPSDEAPIVDEKALRAQLFARARELNLNPAKNIQTTDLEKLIEENENN